MTTVVWMLILLISKTRVALAPRLQGSLLSMEPAARHNWRPNCCAAGGHTRRYCTLL